MPNVTLIVAGIDWVANGWVMHKGISHRVEHQSGEDAGMMLDGETMRLDYIGTRIRLDVTLEPLLPFETVSRIMRSISPLKWFDVTYDDLLLGQVVTDKFYSNNTTQDMYGYFQRKIRYQGFKIPLISGWKKNYAYHG